MSSVPAPRLRHPDKDIEAVLTQAEAHGWTFLPGKKYWKGRCGCGDHLKSVHKTPSSGYYANHLVQWFRRTCWPEQGASR